ncbi:MAG: hypothetical protein MZW92_19305 [Comamonadaceae bacterium]|nr:hypothetical protein [Comamonadaceae bacterium]
MEPLARQAFGFGVGRVHRAQGVALGCGVAGDALEHHPAPVRRADQRLALHRRGDPEQPPQPFDRRVERAAAVAQRRVELGLRRRHRPRSGVARRRDGRGGSRRGRRVRGGGPAPARPPFRARCGARAVGRTRTGRHLSTGTR